MKGYGISLSNDELNTLSSFDKLLNANIKDGRLTGGAKKKFSENIKQFFGISYLKGDVSVNDDVEAFKQFDSSNDKEAKLVRLFSGGIAAALLLGYMQSLENDIDRGQNKPSLFFAGVTELLEQNEMSVLNDFIGEAESRDKLQIGFCANIREDITAEAYFTSGAYKEDIKALQDLLIVDLDDGYNKKMLDAIRVSSSLGTTIDNYMTDLRSVYKIAFEETFGLRPYAGTMIGGKSGFITIEDDSNSEHVITDGKAILVRLSKRIEDRISKDIKISESRQFDYDEIFDSGEKVVYFPKKILEYALARESTLNMTSGYKVCSYAESWEMYSEGYLFPNLKSILERGIYKALERTLLSRKKIKSTFISSNFAMQNNINGESGYVDFLDSMFSDSGIFDSVFNYIKYLINSMSCFFILTKYGFLSGKITNIAVRVSVIGGRNYFTTSFSGDAGSDSRDSEFLFADLITSNKHEVYKVPFDLTKGRKSETAVDLSTSILEFQYDVNPMLARAEPLFGYVVQQANRRKKKAASWQNILIGETYSGKELYAKFGSDIPLQNFFTHNIIAGSRSGKGVMTMNILVSAVAANRPVFYMDRKPDMGAMLYELSGGQQFIVNGGLYNSSNDTYGHFNEDDGAALSQWKATKSWLESHPKILELFGTATTTYNGSILGDYCYFRAVLFCLGLCCLRGALAGNKNSELLELRNNMLNGNDGICIVIDELTGFQSGISKLLGDINSLMVQKALHMGSVAEVLSKKSDIENKIKVAYLKHDEAKKESAKEQQMLEIEKLNRQLSEIIDVQAAYAATLFTKICENYEMLSGKFKVACFANTEFRYSDIFVLGQILDAGYYASSLTSNNKGKVSSVLFPVTADKSDYFSAYKGADIVRSYLEELGELDWFIGRNPDYNYGNKSADSNAKSVIDTDGNWSYIGKHSCNEVRGVDKAEFNHVLFRPYLVLNTNDEEPSGDIAKGMESKTFQFVSQCAMRCNSQAGDSGFWESIRPKHLNPVAKADYNASHGERKNYGGLHEGIGFKGLVKETLLTTEAGQRFEGGDADIDGYIAEVLGRSGKIADFVAKKMGYTNWQDLIFDLSPKGLFSFQDIINAVMKPEDFAIEKRLPLFAQLGLLDEIGLAPEESDNEEGGLVSDEDLTDLLMDPDEGTTSDAPQTPDSGDTQQSGSGYQPNPGTEPSSMAEDTDFNPFNTDNASDNTQQQGGSYQPNADVEFNAGDFRSSGTDLANMRTGDADIDAFYNNSSPGSGGDLDAQPHVNTNSEPTAATAATDSFNRASQASYQTNPEPAAAPSNGTATNPFGQANQANGVKPDLNLTINEELDLMVTAQTLAVDVLRDCTVEINQSRPPENQLPRLDSNSLFLERIATLAYKILLEEIRSKGVVQ